MTGEFAVDTETFKVIKPRDVPIEQGRLARMLLAGWVDKVPAGSQTAIDVAEMMTRAVPYLWTHDIIQTAKASPLPKHVVSSGQTPHPVMWWSWERDMLSRRDDGSLCVTWGMLVIDHGSALEVIGFGQNADDAESDAPATGTPFLYGARVKAGDRYPEDVSVNGREVLALLGFLNSPYVEAARVSTRPHNKGQLRRLATAPTPAVSVVRLRAAVNEAMEDGGRRDVGWRVRWMVRGHYRAQWYPSTRSHKIIWIAPYLKGPDQAPFKVPVFVVDR